MEIQMTTLSQRRRKKKKKRLLNQQSKFCIQLEQLPLTDVRFGRQVEDHVDVLCVEDVVYQPRVTHISLLNKEIVGS